MVVSIASPDIYTGSRAENPPQNHLTTKVTKKGRKEHKERAINE